MKKSKVKGPLILHLQYSEDQVLFKDSTLNTDTGSYNQIPDSPIEPANDISSSSFAPFQKNSRIDTPHSDAPIVAYNDFSDIPKPKASHTAEKTQSINDDFVKTNDGILIKQHIKGLHSFLNSFDDVWPESTSVWCWHCCHPFSNFPIGIPIKLVPSFDSAESNTDASLRKYLVFGVFCSPNCALAFSLSQDIPTVDRTNVKQLLILMIKDLTGQPHVHITPAPSRFVLSTFGGDLSIEQFRSCSKSNFVYQHFVQPLVGMRIEMECVSSIENKYRPIPKASLGSNSAPTTDTILNGTTVEKKKRGPKPKTSNTVDITNFFGAVAND